MRPPVRLIYSGGRLLRQMRTAVRGSKKRSTHALRSSPLPVADMIAAIRHDTEPKARSRLVLIATVSPLRLRIARKTTDSAVSTVTALYGLTAREKKSFRHFHSADPITFANSGTHPKKKQQASQDRTPDKRRPYLKNTLRDRSRGVISQN